MVQSSPNSPSFVPLALFFLGGGGVGGCGAVKTVGSPKNRALVSFSKFTPF